MGLFMPYNLKIIILFALGWIIIYADRAILYPLLSIIGKDFNLTGIQMGLITGIYFLFGVCAPIPAGFLGDKIGLKKVLIFVMMLASGGIALIGLMANNYMLLLLFMAMHGIGVGAYYTTTMGITMKTIPHEKRGISSAMVVSGMSIGLATGLVIAGPFYLRINDWKTIFLIMSIPTFIIGILFIIAVKEVQSVRKISGEYIWDLITHKRLLAINFASFCSHFGFWVVITWGPVFFFTERNFSLSLSGAYTAVIAIAALPATLLAGKLSDIIGRKVLCSVFLPIAAITLILMPLVKDPSLLFILLFIYGIVGKLTVDPVIISWISDITVKFRPQAIATSVGVYSFLSMSSAIIAPPLCGLIRDVTGSLQGAYYLGGIILLAGFISILIPSERV